MSLSVIHGKPGSGKTCYSVYLLVTMLADWARYYNEKGEHYPSRLYTNIPLHVEAINEHLSAELGFEVDLTGRIELLDEDFFRDENGEYREWWNDFEKSAYIVIDEVHYYLPASIKRQKGGQAIADKFTNYVSTHRKLQHELVFVTQHVNKVSTEVRKDVEVLLEVLNIKNEVWGIWPFTVPLSDIDVVRESFGMSAQMAHIRRGLFDANRVKNGKGCEVFLLRPWIFDLYRSHAENTMTTDRPSLRLGRLGSIAWLFRRHFFRLAMWAAIGVTIISVFVKVCTSLPGVLIGSFRDIGTGKPEKTSVVRLHGENEPVVPPGVPSVYQESSDDVIIGFVRGGVITPKGVLRKDDHIVYEGEKDFVKSVDVVRGIVYFGSGKKLQK